MNEIKFEIIEKVGVLSESEKGWKKDHDYHFISILNNYGSCFFMHVCNI